MGDKTEWFIIEDLEKFIESTRVLVFDKFGKTNETQLDELTVAISQLTEQEVLEMNECLSQAESLVISKDFIKKEKNKKNKSIRLIVSNIEYFNLIEALNSRMVSNILNALVNKNLLEVEYDSKINDFIFWPKEDIEKRS